MKATILKSILSALIISSFATSAHADMEAVSILATNVSAVGVDMERINEQLIDQVSADYSQELIDQLDVRLSTEFNQFISSAQ